MSRNSFREVLSKYLPESSVDICVSWIMQKNIHLTITKSRASKYGDYRPLPDGKGHQITVNHDLNPYSFLITFVHEVAHLQTFIRYKHYHEPHGREWKNEFSALLSDFIHRGIFPDDVRSALAGYIRNPAASSCTDHDLQRTLKRYDQKTNDALHLEDLEDGSLFTLHQSSGKLVFRKGHLLRKRFQCLELNSRRIYFVSPLAEVVEIQPQKNAN